MFDNQKSCFVSMSARDATSDRLYWSLVQPAIRLAGLRAWRIEQMSIGNWSESILNAIRKASVVVAAITDRNPNIFYEIGIAKGMGKPIIPIVRSTSDLPFDLRDVEALVVKDGSEPQHHINRLAEALARVSGTESNSEWLGERAPEPLMDEVSRAKLAQDASSALSRGDVNAALGLYRSLARAQELAGDKDGFLATHRKISELLQKAGDYTAASQALEEEIGAAKSFGSAAEEAIATANLASVLVAMGRIEEAETYYRRGLDIAVRLGNEPMHASIMFNLGSLNQLRGELDAARAAYSQALAVFRMIGDNAGASSAVANLGSLAMEHGDLSESISLYREALALLEQIGDVYGAARIWHNLGAAHARLGDFAQAVEYYRRSLEAKQRVGDRSGEAATLANLGTLMLEAGDLSSAEDSLRKALSIQEHVGDRVGAMRTLQALSRVAGLKSAPEIEERYLAEALSIAEAVGSPDKKSLLHRITQLSKSIVHGGGS